MADQCFVCGTTDKPLAIRGFEVLGRRIEGEPICQACFELPTDEWSEPTPWSPEIVPGEVRR